MSLNFYIIARISNTIVDSCNWLEKYKEYVMENMETLAEDHIENLDQWIKDKETEGFMIVHGAS